MGVNSDKNSELYDLSTVAVAIFSDAPETLRQRANVLNAGALEITSSEDLQAFKKQKLAIILDQQTPANLLQTQVKKFEEYIRSNPESSVRFFLLHWSQDKEVPDGDRFESINIDQISANDFPAIINKILYKARLPLFLRNGYDVEIKPKLANIGGVEYRPIVIRSYNPSEIDTACEYSEYDYIYGTDSGNWVLRVTDDGELQKIDWSEWENMPKEGVRIKKATLASHFYSKKYRRFYRFPGPYLLTEVPIQETNSGSLAYVTEGLYIHNKRLFQKKGDEMLEVSTENSMIKIRRHGSKITGDMSLDTLKSSES